MFGGVHRYRREPTANPGASASFAGPDNETSRAPRASRSPADRARPARGRSPRFRLPTSAGPTTRNVTRAVRLRLDSCLSHRVQDRRQHRSERLSPPTLDGPFESTRDDNRTKAGRVHRSRQRLGPWRRPRQASRSSARAVATAQGQWQAFALPPPRICKTGDVFDGTWLTDTVTFSYFSNRWDVDGAVRRRRAVRPLRQSNDGELISDAEPCPASSDTTGPTVSGTTSFSPTTRRCDDGRTDASRDAHHPHRRQTSPGFPSGSVTLDDGTDTPIFFSIDPDP